MFALHILEEGGLGREEAVLQLLLQAAVPTAHAAVHRHLAARGPQRTGRAAWGCDAPGDAAPGAEAPPRLCGARCRGISPGAGRAWLQRRGPCSLPGAPTASGCKHRSDPPRSLARSPAHLASAVSRLFTSWAPAPALRLERRAPSRHLPRLPAPFLPGAGQGASEATSSRKVPQSGAQLSRRPSLPAPLHPLGATGPRAPQVGLRMQGRNRRGWAGGGVGRRGGLPLSLFSLLQTAHSHHP